jgi:D-alanine-D-alanine ligase
MRCMDKVLAKHALRDAGLPTPDFYAFSQTAFESLGAAHALPGDRGAARLPDRRQAGGAGLGARDQVRAHAADVPGAIVAAFSYDTKVLLERHVAGRDLAVSVLEGRRARGAAVVEAIPRGGDSTTSRRATRSGRTDVRCPADLGPTRGRAQALALDALRRARVLRASRAST